MLISPPRKMVHGQDRPARTGETCFSHSNVRCDTPKIMSLGVSPVHTRLARLLHRRTPLYSRPTYFLALPLGRGHRASTVVFSPPRGVNSPRITHHSGRIASTISSSILFTAFS